MGNKRFILGRKARCYFSATDVRLTAAGAAAKTTWLDDAGTAEANNVRDVAVNIDPDWVDGTEREEADGGFASEIPVINAGEITFETRWREQDDARYPLASPYQFQELLIKSWEAFDQITLAFLDQSRANPGAGSSTVCRGLVANFSIGLNILQPIRDVQRANVTLKVDRFAAWYTEEITGA